MKVDTSPKVGVSRSGGYWPASVSEALRLQRHGYGEIMDSTVRRLVDDHEKCLQAVYGSKRALERYLRNGDLG